MTPSDTPLLPCKHCGSTASFHEIEDMDDENFGGHYIACDNTACGMTTNLRFASKEDPRPLLAEQWNRCPMPSSLADDEDERGFTPSDYAHTAKLLRSSEPIRKATASNNHNIILAALDLCASRRPRPPGEPNPRATSNSMPGSAHDAADEKSVPGTIPNPALPAEAVERIRKLEDALDDLLYEDSDKTDGARLVTRIKARALLALHGEKP